MRGPPTGLHRPSICLDTLAAHYTIAYESCRRVNATPCGRAYTSAAL